MLNNLKCHLHSPLFIEFTRIATRSPDTVSKILANPFPCTSQKVGDMLPNVRNWLMSPNVTGKFVCGWVDVNKQRAQAAGR